MTPADTARVLAKAAAFDQRTIGAADVAAWHEAIGDLDAADALAAVTRHFQQTEQRIMPSHIRRLTAEIARERRKALREAAELRALESEQTERRTDRSSEIAAFVQQIRDALPAGDQELLRPRATYWEREHRAYRRHMDGAPNPDYDPSASIDSTEG
jgi:hypothetical protein